MSARVTVSDSKELTFFLAGGNIVVECDGVESIPNPWANGSQYLVPKDKMLCWLPSSTGSYNTPTEDCISALYRGTYFIGSFIYRVIGPKGNPYAIGRDERVFDFGGTGPAYLLGPFSLKGIKLLNLISLEEMLLPQPKLKFKARTARATVPNGAEPLWHPTQEDR